MDDLADIDGVEWVALIGADALTIEHSPPSEQGENAAAMWIALESRAEVLLGGVPEKFTLGSDKAILLSHRLDNDHVVLMRASPNSNIGKLRKALSDASERIKDLL